MNLPALITNLFDTASRRRDQLKSLDAKAEELRAEYEAAIASGSDDQADKIAAKLMRTQIDAAAARMAIETAERQAREREADEARIEQQRKEHAHVEAGASYEREVLLFEAQAEELLKQWHVVREAGENVQAKAVEAHVEFGHEPLMHVWNLVFTRFQQGTQRRDSGTRDRNQMVMPPGRSPSRPLETLAERIARKRADPTLRHHLPPQGETL